MPLMPKEKVSRWWWAAKLPLFILVVSVLVPYYWMTIGAFKTVPELVQQPPTFVVPISSSRGSACPCWRRENSNTASPKVVEALPCGDDGALREPDSCALSSCCTSATQLPARGSSAAGSPAATAYAG